MKKIAKFIFIVAIVATSGVVFAQESVQTVSVNSTHKYKMGENISSNKYLWRITKSDNSDATLGTDYKFVVDYDDGRTPKEAGVADIALANGENILDFSLAKEEQNEIFIKWLKEGKYNVTARVFDASSGCSDEDFNESTYGVIEVGPSMLKLDLKWNFKGAEGVAREMCAVYEDNEINYLVTIQGHRKPKDLDGNATAEELDCCKWRYKYEYIVSNSETLPDASNEGWKKGIGTDGKEGDFVEVDFNLDEYKNNVDGESGTNTSDIVLTLKLDQGDAQFHIWVKVTEVIDGFGTSYGGDYSLLSTDAIVNQIPKEQKIISD